MLRNLLHNTLPPSEKPSLTNELMTAQLAKTKLTGKIELFQFVAPPPHLYDSVLVALPDEELLAIRKVFDQYDVMQAQLRELLTEKQKHAQHTSPA